ncbi:MAG: late competence development ComFB family protein [Lachnospiraceae bacterium]|nr:late competence development ComFB family protein [Lachnospiraceae bacterium]
MKGLKNMMEDNVERTINQVLATMPNICSCEDCKLDMATYALNRLQPKYTRTSTGVILHRFDTASTQAEAEILTVVVSAINVIGEHPHHASKSTVPATDDTPADQAPADSDNSTEAQAPVSSDNSANA